MRSNSTLPVPAAKTVATTPTAIADSSKLRSLPTLPQLSLKNKILKSLHLLTYYSGLSSLYAATKKTRTAAILMYHSIPAPQEKPWIDPCNCLSAQQFEEQIQFLAAQRNVVSLDRLLKMRQQGSSIAKGTVAITFDDGYLNNLTVAAPILAKYQLPATIYLATAFVSAGENQWIDTLYSTFRARSQHTLDLSDFSPSLQQWDLNQPQEQTAAYGAIAQVLIEATVSQRTAILTAIDQQLAPTAYPPRLTMTWEDARQLQREYPNITLGVHTANHIDLETHSEFAEQEIVASITAMERELGERPKHLAFPYNRFNKQSKAQAARYLRSAVADSPNDGVVRTHTSNYELPRLCAPRSLTMLKSWTNGGFPDTGLKLFRRAWLNPY